VDVAGDKSGDQRKECSFLQRFAEVLTDKRKWREETKTQRGRAVERSGRALQRRDGT
jgi:hypothetical protein